MKGLAGIADAILDDVNSATVKTTAPTSEIGQAFLKIAGELRMHQAANPTYQDLREFRKRHAV